MPDPETADAPSSKDRAPSTFERRTGYLLLIAVIVVIGAIIFKAPPQRQFHILAINDTYRIGGLYDGTLGGPARVRSLRRELEKKHGGPVLLLHGGDVISPSFIGRMYDGEQMIDVLNLMDGREDAFDPYMFIVLGNHEFDEDGPVLEARLRESEFTWLGANVIFKSTEDGTPLVGSANLKSDYLVAVGGIKVGIFGLVLDIPNKDFVERFVDPLETARLLTRKLKGKGAEVVIALTHQTLGADERLLKKLCGEGLDLIVGGHEHTNKELQVTCAATGRKHYVLKADADAASARHITITLTTGQVTLDQELRQLKDSTPVADPDIKAKAQAWRDKHQKHYCNNELNLPSDCLDAVNVGATNIQLEAEEIRIRSYETNLGDWIADRMLAGYPGQFVIDKSAKDACDTAPRVAFINSGSLRLNQDLNRDGIEKFPIKLRHFEELFQYDNSLVLIKIDGKTLHQVATNAASDWEGNGRWLQVAGFGFRHDGKGNVLNVSLLDGDGNPLASDLAAVPEICAITSEYLVNPDFGDQDGYSMLNRGQVLNDLSEQEKAGQQWPRKLKAIIRAAFEATKTGPITKDDIKMGRTCRYDPKDEKKTCRQDETD